jgi:hypothetical protein
MYDNKEMGVVLERHRPELAPGANGPRRAAMSSRTILRRRIATGEVEAKAFATRKIANLRHGACRKASRSRRAAASADAVLADHLA